MLPSGSHPPTPSPNSRRRGWGMRASQPQLVWNLELLILVREGGFKLDLYAAFESLA
jgi:hypothetical protein